MAKTVRLDGKQVTMPLFDCSLLKESEEMARPVKDEPCRTQCRRHFIMIGCMPAKGGAGNDKRLLAAGSIRAGRMEYGKIK